MNNEYSSIWVHAIWFTYKRLPVLTSEIRPALLDHIREYAAAHGYQLDCINALDDHVHCLVRLQPDHAVSRFVGHIKGESSHWINRNALTLEHFAWQPRYSAFSVGFSDVEEQRSFIENQEAYHLKTTLSQELVDLFQRAHVA
jgi:putative transposase